MDFAFIGNFLNVMKTSTNISKVSYWILLTPPVNFKQIKLLVVLLVLILFISNSHLFGFIYLDFRQNEKEETLTTNVWIEIVSNQADVLD